MRLLICLDVYGSSSSSQEIKEMGHESLSSPPSPPKQRDGFPLTQQSGKICWSAGLLLQDAGSWKISSKLLHACRCARSSTSGAGAPQHTCRLS